ncbi:phosphorylase family protein [Microcoleus sp. B9-D4]|uniref:phosphorylase family protein n=1 Tax=Microcoleus sp. B9-D4 TaxID=2818711 RepID=UPI002FCE8E82
METRKKVDIAILTVIPQELAAAKAALGIQDISNNRTRTQDSQTIYLHGELFSERTNRTYRLALGCIGTAGNYNSSQAATEVIQAHDPKLLVLVGIAAGIKGKAKLGEVVFSERVLGYESAALRQLENGTHTIQPRPDMLSVPNGIQQDVIFYLATHKDRIPKSQQGLESRFLRIGGEFPMLSVQDRSYLQEKDIIRGIEIDVCIVASGEKLLKDPLVLEEIRDNQHGRVKVGEMEAIGFANACQRMGRDWLVIRGVSDFGDADKSDVFHRLASQTAATVLADFLQYSLDLQLSDTISPSNLKEEFLNASKGLLNWKRTLGDNNQQITRPELEQLIDRIETETSSTTIVLGSPGCGKSALMATLGHWAVEQKYVLLGIQAGSLNNTVNTIEDLQHDIEISKHPKEAVKAIANTEKVILLIDQLDALSELLDRQPGRLNMLLSFIQSLSETKNVHLVATCREFEFRHGTQFARLDCFQRLDLQLPTWEQISPILENEKHNPHSMGEPLRELLRNPFHLRIFLEIAKPNQVFESFPNLLDQLWEKRILEEPEAEQSIAFLTKLAERMTEEEVLWLPAAIADECPKICRVLEKAGILMTNPDNSTLGFCHQTLYDHTLARSFARGSQSLSNFVLERQDGLFIRPILLRNLNYLRGTACQKYQREIQALLNTSKQKVRSHIRTLVIEFVGAQSNPNPTEVGLLVPLLNSEIEAIKVLDSMMVSPGWFETLRDRPEFLEWLEKPVEQAVYCRPLLTAAASFAAEDVWSLLEEYWLNDRTYDFLSIRVLFNIGQWTPERVWLTQQVIQRSNIDWNNVAAIAERIAETLPSHAARVIHAHLEQRLAQAISASQISPPELPPDADEVQRYAHEYKYDPRRPLEHLLKSERDFYELEKFAQANPKAFLESIWGWFTNLVDRISREFNLNSTSYREDFLVSLGREPDIESGKIIDALLSAILELARQDRQAFLTFVTQNLQSDLLLVHRLLARGLEKIASQEPQFILNYLVGDRRRLCLGDSIDGNHCDTKRLISSICPHLSPDDREKIENAIHQFDYCHPWENYGPDDRSPLLQYNRIYRLQLLLAFPDECLSPAGKRLRDEEICAFPSEVAEDRYPTVTPAQIVGSRMTKEEMSRASDSEILNLFDELSDKTRWDRSLSVWAKDLSRGGGAIEQSDEFGKLVKNDPDRCLRILPQLQPQRHESYAGKAIVNLSEIEFPASKLIQLVEELNQRGFSSEYFRDYAAGALEKIAEPNQGLPLPVLALLESWLPTHTKPELEYYQSKDERHSDLKSPILFGLGGSHILPGGRGNIVRAIAEGYLRQNPPNLEGWEKFIRSQLGVEPHPAVWVYILRRMEPLLNGDRAQATELFDTVIHNYPEVLQYQFALYFIAHRVGWFEPKETVQSWLEMLRANNSNFSQQAYGELLLIQYFQYQDEWSVERIRHHLATQDNEAILCGLAHAASYLWVEQKCRVIAAEILSTLASSSTESIQHAVASVFRWSRDRFQLNPGMVKIVEAICKNRGALLAAANDLTEIIETKNLVDNNPKIVVKVCQSLTGIFANLTNPAPATAFIAESLTTIAIQLHRQPLYRDIGLQIFEDLLALNLRETRSALETLDRKPNRFGFYIAPRRRLRSRRTDHH